MVMTMDRRLLAAWAGMIGPALFVAIFTVEGWLRPGYDARGMFVSELALGPRGWIQQVNFVVFGVLFLVFAQGVAAEFREGRAARAGPVLLFIIGISFLASGFFAMDPASTPRDQLSWHGRLHNFFGALVFSLVACELLRVSATLSPAPEVAVASMVDAGGGDAICSRGNRHVRRARSTAGGSECGQ